MDSSATGKQAASGRVASFYGLNARNYGARQSGTFAASAKAALDALVGPFVRVITKTNPPVYNQVRDQCETLELIQQFNYDSLVARLQAEKRVSRVIAQQMLTRQIQLVKQGIPFNG